jgi:hypothetical protein
MSSFLYIVTIDAYACASATEIRLGQPVRSLSRLLLCHGVL